MSICYPESRQFYSKATSLGCKHERTARDAYVTLKKKDHHNFSVRECGLFIDPSYPHLGASPDGIITCTCCDQWRSESRAWPGTCPAKVCPVYVCTSASVKLLAQWLSVQQVPGQYQ